MVDDFIQGQKDCKNGLPHTSGKSKDYDYGYSYQYELEQRAEYESRRSIKTA